MLENSTTVSHGCRQISQADAISRQNGVLSSSTEPNRLVRFLHRGSSHPVSLTRAVI